VDCFVAASLIDGTPWFVVCQTRLDDKEFKAGEIKESFKLFKNEILSKAENSRTGKKVPKSVIDAFEAAEQGILSHVLQLLVFRAASHHVFSYVVIGAQRATMRWRRCGCGTFPCGPP